MHVLSRDPFARANFVRRTVPLQDRGPCAECRQPAKYQYDVDQDRIGRSRAFTRRPFASFDPRKVFCSVGCFRSHG